MELGFEFRRDLERLVHDRVLSSRRSAQRIRFRPGVSLSSSHPVDVQLHQRSKKKLTRALHCLREDYGTSLEQTKEALGYTNSIEDALSFLALQYTSDELPPTLRAQPSHLMNAKYADEYFGELVVEAHEKKETETEGKTEMREIEQEDLKRKTIEGEKVEKKTMPDQEEALSWTHQYVLNMSGQEEEKLNAGIDITLKVQELEKRYNELVSMLNSLKKRKSKKRTKSDDKHKIRELNSQIQETRQQLLEYGWKELRQPMIMETENREKRGALDERNDADNGKTALPALSTVVMEDTDSDVVSLAVTMITEESAKNKDTTLKLQEIESKEEELCGNSGSQAQVSKGEDEGGLFGLLEEAEATVVSAAEIKKSDPVDTAAIIAAQAVAASKLKKGKGSKNKKGRNMLKVQAAAAQAAQTQAATAIPWTGKTPRDLLEQHCRKNGMEKPQYKKLSRPAGGGHLYSVILATKSGKQEFSVKDARDAGQGFETISDAKDMISTIALYELTSDLPLYLVLPPLYRDMWQQWLKKRHENEAILAVAKQNEEDDLLDEVFNALPREIAEKKAVVEGSEPALKHPSYNVKKATETTDNMLKNWTVDDWDVDLSDEEKNSVKEIRSDDDAVEIEEENESARSAALELSRQLREQLQQQMRSRAYQSKLKQRESLPIASFKQQVIDMLSNHDVILISGETGCGKSTQVPQFLLEDLLLSEPGGARGQIVCTQPRRLAAISLAERVSEELGESSMGTDDSLTGFQIRLEARMTHRTRLLFCTTGILLRKLQDPCTLGKEVSHVIVDEVHERDLQSDVLLAMLRQFLAEGNAVRRRQFGGTLPPLKVILMSATLNAASFQTYFGGDAVCPMIEVPGRTFPVEQFYLEDVLEMTKFIVDEESSACIPINGISGSEHSQSTQIKISGRGGSSYTQQVSWTSSCSVEKTLKEKQNMLADTYSQSTLCALERLDPSVVNYELIQALVEHIVTETDLLLLDDKLSQRVKKSASVLVFLPGLHEITTLLDILGGSRLLRHDERGREFELLPLHSSLSAQEQKRIFRQRPGVVRIIASTNIAETSLTIDDVKVVIDTGRVKQMSHDAQRRTNMLEEIWVARANAKQRSGRAGRTSGGSCFRLFPKSVFNTVMLEQPVPEIRRSPLTSLCLQVKTFGMGGNKVQNSFSDFVRACLDPPDDDSIRDALEELFQVGALNREDETLTKLGDHLARLPVDIKVGKILLLGALFGVFDAASTCAALLETKSPFVSPFGYQSEMKKARQKFAIGASDLLTDVNAFETWRYVAQHGKSSRVTETSFCREHYLSAQALRELSKLKRHFRDLAARLGFLPPHEPASDEQRMTVQQLATISAVLYAGLAPNLVHLEQPAVRSSKYPVLRERDHSIVVVHPGSINYKVAYFPSSLLTYAVKLHTSQVYLPMSSLVMPLAVCLFSTTLELLPQLRHKDKEGNETIGLRVNEWVVFYTSFRSAVLVQELRNVVLETIDANLQTPPHAQGAGNQTKTQTSDRELLIDVLQMGFLAEFEERDPNKHLSSQLSVRKQKMYS